VARYGARDRRVHPCIASAKRAGSASYNNPADNKVVIRCDLSQKAAAPGGVAAPPGAFLPSRVPELEGATMLTPVHARESGGSPDRDDSELLFDPLYSDGPIDAAAVRADDAFIDAVRLGDIGCPLIDPADLLVRMLIAWATSARTGTQ
jgi:hypothetical protein